MDDRLRVITVCTHNRTRSVLMAGLLGKHADEVGLQVDIATTGFIEAGLPPTDRTVKLLKRAGIDMASHRSSRLHSDHVRDADLILTAERAHVVSIASRWPTLFGITFTLPEAVERGEEIGPRGDRDPREWIGHLSESRPSRLVYMDDRRVTQVADPTGRSPGDWRRAFNVIDELTERLAVLLA